MDTKKLREIAEWYDTTRTDAGYLFSGERGEASRAWHRAVTTQSILALLDENDSLRAEVERLGKLRDIIERLAQFNEEEAKAWILSEYGARKAGAAVALRSVLREFDSIGKDGGNG